MQTKGGIPLTSLSAPVYAGPPQGGIVISRDLVYKFLKSLEHEHNRAPATLHTYYKIYRLFWQHLQAQGIKSEKSRITKQIVQGWVLDMRGKGIAPSTVRSRLTALSAMFSWMHKEGHIKGNPVAPVPRPKVAAWKPRGALTSQQTAKVWGVALKDMRREAPQARVGLLMMWNAGARIGEVIGANWEDIDLTKRAWQITGKGGKTRWVPLTAALLIHLTALKEMRKNPQGGPILINLQKKRITKEALFHKVKRWCRAAGIPQASPHWFRHTFVTTLAERAAVPMDIERIRRLAGHASIATTQIYLTIHEEDRSLVDLAFEDEGESP